MKIRPNCFVHGRSTLLDGKDPESAYVSLTTNKDVEKLLGTSSGEGSSSTDEDNEIAVGMYYVSLITEGKNNTWYCTLHHVKRKMTMIDTKWSSSNGFKTSPIQNGKMEMKKQTF